jgi:hypothetical protein
MDGSLRKVRHCTSRAATTAVALSRTLMQAPTERARKHVRICGRMPLANRRLFAIIDQNPAAKTCLNSPIYCPRRPAWLPSSGYS